MTQLRHIAVAHIPSFINEIIIVIVPFVHWCWFVLVGWAIYPIGYMAGTSGWYSDIFSALDGQMEVIYNVGDAVNKIGFGLVVYNLAVSK